jgi:hypothetical protein
MESLRVITGDNGIAHGNCRGSKGSLASQKVLLDLFVRGFFRIERHQIGTALGDGILVLSHQGHGIFGIDGRFSHIDETMLYLFSREKLSHRFAARSGTAIERNRLRAWSSLGHSGWIYTVMERN